MSFPFSYTPCFYCFCKVGLPYMSPSFIVCAATEQSHIVTTSGAFYSNTQSCPVAFLLYFLPVISMLKFFVVDNAVPNNWLVHKVMQNIHSFTKCN